MFEKKILQTNIEQGYKSHNTVQLLRVGRGRHIESNRRKKRSPKG